MSIAKITVTSPLLPDIEEYNVLLKEIWESKWITNNGTFHKQLEKELASYLKALSESFYKWHITIDNSIAGNEGNRRGYNNSL